MRAASFVVAAVLLTSTTATSEVFVDVGACPGEGCVYGEVWTAREPIVLRAAPRDQSEIVATVAAKERVTTLTGEVHTRPGRFLVTEARGSFEVGAVLLLYTYLGEGWFRVRHDGVLAKADLGLSPWSRRCRSTGEQGCWGVLERNVESKWWVKARTGSDIEGWTLDSKALEKPGPP